MYWNYDDSNNYSLQNIVKHVINLLKDASLGLKYVANDDALFQLCEDFSGFCDRIKVDFNK